MNRPATAEEKRKQQENRSVNQGFVKDEDLANDENLAEVMSPDEVDTYARKAASESRVKVDKLQGEGDYEAAENYDNAATDFAQKQKQKKGHS